MALVSDLSTQNTTFLILRSENSATGFVAGSVPLWHFGFIMGGSVKMWKFVGTKSAQETANGPV